MKVMLFLLISSLILFWLYPILAIIIRKKNNTDSKYIANSVSICISYIIFDLILISSFFITKEISELLYISSFITRTLFICITHCYSSGFIERSFKNIFHKDKFFMFLFINNGIITLCDILVNSPFMFYLHIVFAILQTILAILILKSRKSNI